MQGFDITIYQKPTSLGHAGSPSGFTQAHEIKAGDTAAFAKAVKYDNCPARYRGGYRSGVNFECANCVMGDTDNTHSDDPAEWVTQKDIATRLPNVVFYSYPSRNNMKVKDGRSPRPKEHHIFPLDTMTDVNEYAALMQRLTTSFPELHFDEKVKSPAQFNFGVGGLREEDIIYTDGDLTLTEFLENERKHDLDVTCNGIEDKKDISSQRKVIREGERNTTLSRRAGQILKRYGDTEEARRRYDELCEQCEPRLDESEENTIYRSAQQFFHNIIEQSPTYKPADLYDAPPFAIPTDKGYNISAPLLCDYYLEHHPVIVVTDSGSPRVYEYDSGAYVYRKELEVKAALGEYITGFRRGLWNSGKIAEAYSAIIHTPGLFVKQSQLNADPNIVCLRNGLLNLKDWKLRPHDPSEYYSTRLDCDFTADFPETPVYDKTLYDYCEGSAEKQRFMMQYQGAIFSNVPGYKFKRFLLTIGERDSGKTIMKRLTEILVGDGNYNNCDLADLENNRFAAASLHLKKLSGTNDLRSAKIPEVGRLLQLTGGDSMRVERKGEQDFSMIYTGYIWHVGNNKPIYGGKQNEALYLREILFELNHTIPQEKQDHHLLEKLVAEKQGIILKCLYSARKAIYDNDYRFDVPSECERSKCEHKQANNVISQFLSECTAPLDLTDMKKGEAEKHTAAKVWQAFKSWRDYVGEYKGITRNDFEGELAAIYNLDVKQIKQNQHRGDVAGRFYPVMLNDDGIRYNGDNFLQ